MNNNNIKNGILFVTLWSWPVLGFKRGINSYNYNYSNNKIYKPPTRPLYLDKVCWGLAATITYINPCTFFIVLYKEVYRLEVNLRELEDEKKTDYYNKVL